MREADQDCSTSILAAKPTQLCKDQPKVEISGCAAANQ